MSDPSLLIVAGTGHRPPRLAGSYEAYDDEFHRSVVSLAGAALDILRPDAVISGMALGFDQALAEAALERKITLVAALPSPNHGEKWPRPSRVRHAEILSHATHVQICSPVYVRGCEHVRDRWMVENSDAIIAMWDGKAGGGTADTMKMAEDRRKPIFRIYPPRSILTARSTSVS